MYTVYRVPDTVNFLMSLRQSFLTKRYSNIFYFAGILVSRSHTLLLCASMRVYIHTYMIVYTYVYMHGTFGLHTYTYTCTQTKYCNPRCACTPRVNCTFPLTLGAVHLHPRCHSGGSDVWRYTDLCQRPAQEHTQTLPTKSRNPLDWI